MSSDLNCKSGFQNKNFVIMILNYIKSLQASLYPTQAIKDNYKNALKCFIVYDNENARAASGFYQCKNNCIDCLKCYKKSKNIIYIAEKIH